MKQIRVLLVISLILAVCLTSAAYADPQLSLSVAPRQASLNDQITFRVTIDEVSSIRGLPTLTDGDDFDARLLGPEQRVEIINGRMSARISYVYQLTPKRSGQLKTPGAEVDTTSGKLTAAPLLINVTDAPAPPEADRGPRDVFVEQAASKTKAYLGEQILHQIKVFQRKRIYNAQLKDMSLDGFWQEDLGDEQQSTATIGESSYQVTSIAKALFPLRPGLASIDPVKLTGQRMVRSQSRSPFPDLDILGNPFGVDIDDFFGTGKLKNFEEKSAPLEIQVLPLPTAPKDFPGWNLALPIVGETSISVAYDPTEVHVGDSKTVELTITSTGNLKPITEVPLSESSAFRFYQDTPQQKFEVIGNTVEFTKVLRFSVVPSVGGNLEIPAIRLGYFDPKSGQYKIAESKAIRFHVVGSELPVGSKTETSATEPSTATPNPSLSPTFHYEDQSFLERLAGLISPALALLVIVLFTGLASLVLLFIRSRRQSGSRNKLQQQITRATTVAELAQVFRSSLLAKFPAAGSVGPVGLKAMVSREITDPNLRIASLLLLDELDAALYAKSESAASLDDLKHRAAEILKSLAN